MATKRTHAENLELAKARVGAAPKAAKKAPAPKQLSFGLMLFVGGSGEQWNRELG